MGPIGRPETLVKKNYRYSLRNDPEERSSHLLQFGNIYRITCTEIGSHAPRRNSCEVIVEM